MMYELLGISPEMNLVNIVCASFLMAVIFQVKHFMCDYPWQTQYMLGKFNISDWVKPLAAHSAVHAIFTFSILAPFSVTLGLLCALADFVIHFIVDKCKVDYGRANRLTPSDAKFWWAIGIDQLLHHLTHYVFIVALLLYGVYK